MKVFTKNLIERLCSKPERKPVETQTQVETMVQPVPKRKKTFWEKVCGIGEWLWNNGSKIISTVVAVVGVIKSILFIKEKLSATNPA